MSVNLNKRVRIAHIGNLNEVPGETKEQHDEVYDVIRKTLDNVNKSEKKILSYQQLQELKSKEKAISQHNGKTNNCSISSILTNRKKKRHTSKQPKPLLPEKIFPLMKECQKNWKFLKKNRCIPKPRAHVNVTPAVLQKPRTHVNITSTPLQKPRHNVISRSPQKPRSHFGATPSPFPKPAQNVKAFTSNSNSNKYCNNRQLPNLKVTEQNFQENNVEELKHRREQIEFKEQMLSNSDLDYDSEYEKFVQKHKLVKRKSNFSSKSNKHSKIQKVKKSKQRKYCKIKFDEKISKITSKPLSDTDDCSETEVKIPNENNVRNKHTKSSKSKLDLTKKLKKKIVRKNDESCNELKHVHNFNASPQWDTSNFLEYEDLIADSSSEEFLNDNRNGTKHSEIENLILKCKIPCYVLMKRDPILDQKATLFYNDTNSVMNRLIPSTCKTDEEDCIIIEESVKSVIQNPEARGFPSTSRCRSNDNASEKLLNAKLESVLPNTLSCEQYNYASTRKLIFNQDTQIKQANEISFCSKTEASSYCCSLPNDTDNSFPKILSKDLNGMQYSVDKNVNSSETEDCIIICENTGYNSCQKESSRTNNAENSLSTSKQHLNVPKNKISNASNPETDQVILDKNIEESTLNVKILSVETLYKTKASEIIDLLDENEEIKFESVNTNNVNAEGDNIIKGKAISPCVTHSEDSDIEIICLDSPLSAENVGNVSEKVTKVQVAENKYLRINEIVKNVGSETSDKMNSIIKTDKYCSDELPSSGKNDNELLENLKTNLNKQKEISKTSGKVSDAKNNNAKIFELLSSIDFDCIKKVLNSTPNIDMNKMENVNDSSIEIAKTCEPHVKSNKSIDSYSMKNPKEVLIDSHFIEDWPTTNENISANSVDKIVEVDSLKEYPDHSLKKDFTLQTENQINLSIRNKSNSESSLSVPEFSKNIEKDGSSWKDAINLKPNNLYSDDECQIILHKSFTGTSSTSSKNSLSNHIQLKEDNVTCLINNSSEIPVDCKPSEATIISSQNAHINMSQASSFNKVVENKLSSAEVSKKISKLKHESFLLPENVKLQNNAKIEKDSALDELDLIATKSIFNIDEHKRPTIMPLLNLYKSEYKKYKAIKCTEKNVSAGLRLLEENQAKKLMHISSSIKNLVKHDSCFEKVFNKCEKFQIDSKFDLKNEKEDIRKKNPSFMSGTNISISEDIKNENYGSNDSIKIFHPSVVESAAEVVRTKSSGSLKDLEVYNHLINSKCAECGKQALAACSGCAKVYYCSENCGVCQVYKIMQVWRMLVFKYQVQFP